MKTYQALLIFLLVWVYSGVEACPFEDLPEIVVEMPDTI